MNTDENEQHDEENDQNEPTAIATDDQHGKSEAPAPASVPRDEFLLCDSPGSVCDEDGNFPPCAE